MDSCQFGQGARRMAAGEQDQAKHECGLTADARELAWTEREMHVEAILAAAALRDDHAAIREFKADQRDQTANLDAFVNGVDDGPAFRARQLAKADRASAKEDRIAAELDRYVLSDLSASPEECDGPPGRRLGSGSASMESTNSGTNTLPAHAV